MNLRNWFTRLRVGAIVLTAAASLISATSANASLLAYEPFAYPTGPIVGASDGGASSGFTNAWQANSTNANNFVAVSGSFTYTDGGGRSLVTAGNRAWSTGNALGPAGQASPVIGPGDSTGTVGNGASAQTFRDFTTPRGYTVPTDPVATTWMSFLGQDVNQVTTTYTGTGSESGSGGSVKYGRAASVQLFNTNNEQVSFGRGSQNSEPDGYTNDTWAAGNRGFGIPTVASSAPLNLLQFILIRVDHNPGYSPVNATTNPSGIANGNDVAYVWINPSLDTEPTTGSATLTINPLTLAASNDRDYNFNRLRIFAGGWNSTVGYGSIQVDEVRLGTTFGDVTPYTNAPEPGSFVLAAMGLVAVAARRKK